jgi:hypothetical protein
LEHADYIAKLKKIRDDFLSVHITAVSAYPSGNPREEIETIFSSYETAERIERIIAAEEGAGSSEEVLAAYLDGRDQPLV